MSQIETGSKRTQNMTGSNTRYIPALDAIFDKCILKKLNFTVFPQGRIQDFFRRGCTRLLLYFNTNRPHIFFFLQNTGCIRKPQVISGGGAHPLHPPPRSAPVPTDHMCISSLKIDLNAVLTSHTLLSNLSSTHLKKHWKRCARIISELDVIICSYWKLVLVQFTIAWGLFKVRRSTPRMP